jgi:glycosyltransferase involved in cell wall biosynthesis
VPPPDLTKEPHIVFLGRLGNDSFTLKLKGIDRLIHLYKHFPKLKKTTVCMTSNKELKNWLKKSLPNSTVFTNLRKDLIPNVLRPLAGSILFVPSRYEGFSLSLVEGMSQGLVPVTYAMGVAPEIIKNGRNGFIVKNQKEAISRIKQLTENPIMRTYMSWRASQTARQFQSDLMADRLVAFYQNLIASQKSKRSSAKITSPVRPR